MLWISQHQLGSLPQPEAYKKLKLGESLHQAAELILADIGVEAINVDMGGWDLHNTAGTWENGSMQRRLSELSQSLATFYQQIAPIKHKVTIVVMSEFGRRVKQNDSGGTDHGKGGLMMVLGGGINGGQIYGQWPGLDNLDNGDLRITTDYRQVLSELLAIRMNQANHINQVLPDYTSNSYLGVFG